jgi:hypothetical protein
VNALYRFLKSVRLAIVLILVITALSLLASLIPQGRPDEWYQGSYSPALYGIIRFFGLPRLFSSVIFLIPVFLFTLNLGVCAADRLVRRVKNKAAPRHGPDLIHFGLLLLIAGGLVTGFTREEKTWSLAAGESAALTPTYTLGVLSLQSLKYDNGSPKEWTSTVRVTRDGKPDIPSFPIRVNKPLRLKGLSVYQASWAVQGTLDLRNSGGHSASATTGQGFRDGDFFWYFAEAQKSRDAWTIIAVQYAGKEMKPVSTRVLKGGDVIGPFTITGITAREITGLKAVKDPGFAPVLAALGIVLLGLCLTFIQNRGEGT